LDHYDTVAGPNKGVSRHYMKTLLYVDDEETIGRVVSRFFNRRGDVVLLARNIAEACKILEAQEPEVVFIDVWLGSESGFELMHWIEDNLPHLSERVTFVTGGAADDKSPERVWKTLGRPVIQKPFDLASLAYSVDHAENLAGT
jgi:two-component system nitrogen regulation response regulator NtrX